MRQPWFYKLNAKAAFSFAAQSEFLQKTLFMYGHIHYVVNISGILSSRVSILANTFL